MCIYIYIHKDVSFSSGEAARHETDQLPPFIAEVKNWNGAIDLPTVPNMP
jgi:hypothetical protein